MKRPSEKPDLSLWDPLTSSERITSPEPDPPYRKVADEQFVMIFSKASNLIPMPQPLPRCEFCNEPTQVKDLEVAACCFKRLCPKCRLNCDYCGDVLCKEHRVDYGATFVCLPDMKELEKLEPKIQEPDEHKEAA